MMFGPLHLFRPVLDPGLIWTLVPIPMARERKGSLVPVEPPTRTKDPTL